ncbi:ArsR family transcriptional regulator [Allonocardiopsis opalescens]|uniref:ArsR family transcriptional regulator n=1 Tax=Allonocardiopsis opalescens TaxID=1144618 RepID=A0A2T0Q0B9_9ACTN|nr:ArsR family transcriptional regulator [Allonocardiopsis opalescens]
MILMLTADARLASIRRLGRALADPTRCRLLLALAEGPAYPAQLARSLDLTRQNVSNHLSCLRGCGLVRARPEGRQTRYELIDPALAHALDDVLRIVSVVEEHSSPDDAEVRADGGRPAAIGPDLDRARMHPAHTAAADAAAGLSGAAGSAP